jgi:hypothetical protein
MTADPHVAARLPQEAREGIMRAWLAILQERHPGVVWSIRWAEGGDDD